MKISIYSFIWKVVKPYKWYYGLMLLAPIATSFYPLINYYAVKIIVDTFSIGNVTEYYNLIYAVAILIFAQVFLDLTCRLGTFAKWKSEPYVRSNILLETYNTIQHYPGRFFQKVYSGMMISKIRGIVDGYDDFWDNIQSKLLFRVLTCFISIFTLAFMNLTIFYFIILWALIFFTCIYYTSKKLGDLSFKQTAGFHKIFGFISDNIFNISSIISFSSYSQEYKNLKRIISKDLIPRQIRMLKYDIKLQLVSNILYWIMLIVLFILMINLHKAQKITSGEFVFALGMTLEMSEQLLKMVTQIQEFIKQLNNFKSSFEILGHNIEKSYTLKSLIINNAGIKFDNVYFEYETAKPVLKGLTFEIKSGEKVGIVGPSGCGKSTIISLLLKYINPKNGKISIDNQDISQFSLESVRENISLVPQDINLFHRTIFENIKYGKKNATKEEVIQAAKIANIHHAIQELPQKYNTILGERGSTISGGQKERIAIARAVLKDAPILIFDESTANLDARTEEGLYNSLRSFLSPKSKTIIVIAHNFNLLQYMDKIIVINKGRLAEEGNHIDLISKENSLYSKLWHLQHEKK